MLKPSNFKLLLFAVTLLILAFDVLFAIHFTSQMASGKYLQTTGTIRHCKIEYDTSGDSDARRPVVSIRYNYNVNGKDFDGNRYRYVLIDSPEKLISTYKVGDSVPVYYNFNNPKDAVLAAGLNGSDWRRLSIQIAINSSLILGWVFYQQWAKKQIVRHGTL